MGLRVIGKRCATVGILGLASTAIASGCGGSGAKYPDASVFFDARPDTGANSGTGGTGPVIDAGVRPPPTPGAGVLTLLTGPALLVGNGPDSCTNEDGATGDRWCGFVQPSTFPGGLDLWVINVSKAVGGKAIRCDASDLDCLLLTSTLNQQDLTLHRFFGDTLIYYADTGATGGPVYGWRPGMTAGRKLTSNLGLQCVGHPKTDAALCFQNQDSTTIPTQTSADVVAGKLSVGGTTALPKVATVLVGLNADPNAARRYQVGLSAAGDWVAWSTRPMASGVETLSAQKLNDDTTRVVIAEDVARWAFSRDGARWYWLKSYNYSTSGNPLGTLQAAPFPPDPGGAPTTGTTLQPTVASFGTAGDKGLIYFGPIAGGVADLTLMVDRDQPAQTKLIDRSVLRVITVSRDGRTLVYSKSVSTDGQTFDLYAGGADLATPCTLTAMPNSPPPFGTLSEPAKEAFWSILDDRSFELVGNYADLTTCRTQKFASDLWFWTSVKDQGVIFGDGVFGTSLADIDVTLRYAQFASGALPATGTVIQLRANPTFAVLLPQLAGVVFTLNAGGDADGLYVKSDLPFAAAP